MEETQTFLNTSSNMTFMTSNGAIVLEEVILLKTVTYFV